MQAAFGKDAPGGVENFVVAVAFCLNIMFNVVDNFAEIAANS